MLRSLKEAYSSIGRIFVEPNHPQIQGFIEQVEQGGIPELEEGNPAFKLVDQYGKYARIRIPLGARDNRFLERSFIVTATSEGPLLRCEGFFFSDGHDW
jgi:hypothetical protein